ncbi:MAG: ABC transporter substrate-binding protein, partial [Acidimicrobiales bacterium]
MAVAVAALVPAAPAASAKAGPSADLVRIPFPQDDGSLTPYTFELGYSLMTLVYDTLFWRDTEGVPQPWLARSVTPNADGRQLTVRLVPGATWHDAQPVTAEDVAFTFRYVAGRNHPRFTAQLRDVERVDVFDPTTLVISLRRPNPGFSDQPLADLPILPAHLWRTLPSDKVAPDGPAVGSGPYRVTEYRPGQGWRFEANGEYFKGRPAVGALEVQVIRDSTATLEEFKQRRADMVAVSLPRAAQAEVAGLGTSVARGPSYLGTVLLFNTRQAPFDRVEARQAVA